MDSPTVLSGLNPYIVPMHNPPPVRFAVVPSRLLPLALWLLWLFGVVVLGAWCLGVVRLSWRHGLPWAALFLTAGFAMQFMRMARAGELGWNGLTWVWNDPGRQPQEGVVLLQLDWQRGMLLRFAPSAGPGHWILIQQSMQPGSWRDLRRAVHSFQRQRPVTAPDAALAGRS
jgi:hypothetical protein